MSSDDNFTHSSVSAELERPTKKAELRIFLVDPAGLRPTVVWNSEQGILAEYQETIMARLLMLLRLLQSRR